MGCMVKKWNDPSLQELGLGLGRYSHDSYKAQASVPVSQNNLKGEVEGYARPGSIQVWYQRPIALASACH